MIQFNVERMKSYFGDIDLFKEVFKEFKKQYPIQLENLNQSILNKDGLNIERMAHKLKGSVASFMAEEVLEKLSLIENAGSNQDFSNLEGMFNEVKDLITQLANQIEDWLKNAQQAA